MAKKKKRALQRPELTPETRVSEVLTVGWMMAVVTTLVCSIAVLLVHLTVGTRSDNEMVLVFARLLHFAAVVVAVLSLVLLALVLKVRRVAPPPSITWFSIGLAIAVILAGLLY